MFKIGEFSKLTQVTVRMLRYYDETGLLKPSYTDSGTGYRMYSAKQIPVLNKIVYLRDSGFNVSEIAAALMSTDDNGILAQMEEKHKEIENIIHLEKEKLKKIEFARKELLNDKGEMYYNITLKAIPAIRCFRFGELYRIITQKGTYGANCPQRQ